MNIVKNWGVLLVVAGVLSGCGPEHDHKGKTPLVEVAGEYLYKEDLQAALPFNISKDDSVLFAEHYIRNWVEDVLLFDKAEGNIPDNAKIAKLVENYRRALIMHTYLFMVLVNGVQLLSSSFFTAIGKSLRGALLALTRQTFLLIPLTLLLPLRFGIMGVLLAGPVADFSAFVLSVVLVGIELKKQKNSLII